MDTLSTVCQKGSPFVFSGSYLKCIEHKAPTHLRIRPLSLQNAGDASVPMGVIPLFAWKNSSG